MNPGYGFVPKTKATPRSWTSLTASISNSLLKVRLFVCCLQYRRQDLVFVYTKPAAGQKRHNEERPHSANGCNVLIALQYPSGLTSNVIVEHPGVRRSKARSQRKVRPGSRNG